MRIDALRVAIYPNDHRPSHVHVIGAGHEAVVYLNCPAGPVQLRENLGFDGRALRAIASALDNAIAALCETWRTIHGDY